MKKILGILLLLVCLGPLRADSDALANSNFTNGHASWQGDAQDVGSGDLGSDSTANGAIIHLKKDKWTKIYQVFPVRAHKMFYSITYQLSNDFKFAASDSDYVTADLGDIPGYDFQWHLPENCLTLMIQGGDNYEERRLNLDMSKLGQTQTFSGHFPDLHSDVDSVFLIAIPPGEGSVTLTTASLTKADPNAQP
jgi:hypothetical protein